MATLDSMNEHCSLEELVHHSTEKTSHEKNSHDCCHHTCLQHVFVISVQTSGPFVTIQELKSIAYPNFEQNLYSSYLSKTIKPPIL